MTVEEENEEYYIQDERKKFHHYELPFDFDYYENKYNLRGRTNNRRWERSEKLNRKNKSAFNYNSKNNSLDIVREDDPNNEDEKAIRISKLFQYVD